MRFAGCGSFAFGIVLAARLVQRRCIGYGVGERFGETAVPPVVHVKPIRRKECLERESLVLVPIAHEGEAMKYVDLLLRSDARDQIDHVADLGSSNDLRRVLRIDQHGVSAGRLYSPDTLADHGIGLRVLVAFVPSCQSTRSGCSEATASSKRASMSTARSPAMPRL